MRLTGKPTGLNTVFSTSVMTAGVVFAALGVSPDAHAQSSCGMTTIRNPDGTTTTTGTPCPSPSAPSPISGGSSSDNSKGDVINDNSVRIKQLLGIAGPGAAASQLSNCYYTTGGGFGLQTLVGGGSVNWSNDAKTIPGCNEAMLRLVFVQAALGSANPALTALAAYEVVGEEGLNFLKTREGQEAMALFAAQPAPPTAYKPKEGAPQQTIVLKVETSPACSSRNFVHYQARAGRSGSQATYRSCDRK